MLCDVCVWLIMPCAHACQRRGAILAVSIRISAHKDTNKSSANANLFAICRAKVSKAKPKIRISRVQMQIYLQFAERKKSGETSVNVGTCLWHVADWQMGARRYAKGMAYIIIFSTTSDKLSTKQIIFVSEHSFLPHIIGEVFHKIA